MKVFIYLILFLFSSTDSETGGGGTLPKFVMPTKANGQQSIGNDKVKNVGGGGKLTNFVLPTVNNHLNNRHHPIPTIMAEEVHC